VCARRAIVAAAVGVVIDGNAATLIDLSRRSSDTSRRRSPNQCVRPAFNADHDADGQFGKTQRADSGLVQR